MRGAEGSAGRGESAKDNRVSMAKVNPGQFIREVRNEIAKVTWPSRKETTVATVMVFIMAIAAALFFFVVDQILAYAVRLMFGLGS
jgi:preprotein translocase subunit SecE